jgi:hypothetical protein
MGNLDELKATWTDALRRNDTDVVMPILNKALERHGVSIPPNSLTLLKLKRESIQAGLAVIEESTQPTPSHTFQDAIPIVRLKPSPNFSAHVEAFWPNPWAPVPQSRTISVPSSPRTSTHDVLPPWRSVVRPGLAKEPRVPQNRIFILAPSRASGVLH